MNGHRLMCVAIVLTALDAMAQSVPNGHPPKPIYSELPTYPERARMARIVGHVKLSFEVDRYGAVSTAKGISGSPMLRDAALRIVQGWKFQPESIQPGKRYETEFVYVLNVQSGFGEPKLTVSLTDLRRIEVISELAVRPIE